MKSISAIWRAFCFFVGLVIFSMAAQAVSSINLSHKDFWKRGPYPLDGYWDFYPSEFIDPDSTNSVKDHFPVALTTMWNDIEGFGTQWAAFGFATYQVTVYVPSNRPELGLKIPDMYTAYRLYCNGELVSQNGVPGKKKSSSIPKWIPRIVPINARGDSVTLTLHISNFEHLKGGLGNPIIIGPFETISFDRKRESAWIMLLSGGLVIGGLFFLGLFIYDRRDLAVLYFSLFCIAYAYRVIGSQTYVLHELAPELNFHIAIRLEYLSLYLSVLLFSAFLRHLYPQEVNLGALRLFQYLSVFQIVVVLLPVYYFTALFPIYLFAATSFMVYGLFIFIMAAYRRRLGAGLALNSSLLLISSFTILILEFWRVIPPQPVLLFVLYVVFFITQSLLLSYRFGLNQQRLIWKSEASSRSKTEFISNMSHELRTPLNAILGVSTLVERNVSESNLKKQIGSIRKHAEHLTNVINEILSFSELEAEEIHIRAEHFNLNEVFSRLMVSLESIKEDKPIKPQLNLDPQLPEMVRGDGMKLKQALSHLGGLLVRSVNNGELVVEANLQKEDVQKIGLEVVFRFNPGNLDDRLVNLFIDSRDNINSTRMLRYDTQAMGLHMAAQIIRALGGEAFAHGSPARSIGFRLEFSKVEMGQIELEKPINTRLRILVVEDNPVNRKLIEMMFNSLGLSSSMAENGQIALDKVKEGNFHMVFMDLQMPVMDGIESTKLILDQVAHRPIIIALTANSTEDDRQMAMEAGMNDFMTKPLKINELKNMILKWQSVSEILDEL